MPIFDGGAGSGGDPIPNEPGNKTGRPGGGPPGGGPGGGPFGGPGSLAGGGLNPQIFRTLNGLGESLPVILKRRGLPTPGIAPGPPGRTDTVPALLTPGEMVMNTGAVNQPGMAQMLAALNMNGAQQMGPQPMGPQMGGSQTPQGYSQGGMVPSQFCPHCGQPHAQPQGYAQGGFAGFPGSPAPSMVPRQQAGFLGPGGYQGGRPQAGFGQPQHTQAPAPQGGYQYNPEGGVTGGYNPNDPWGAFSNNHDTSFVGQGARGLGGFGQAGYFDPRGNQMLLNAANEGAQGTADALVRRQMSAADLSGLDPAQRAVQKLQALRETGRGVQDIMANTRAGVLGNQNDFAQQLYQQLLQGNQGTTSQTNQARLSDWLQGNQQNREHKDQWGNLAGGVLGSAAGGYLGGGGKKP